MNWTLELLVILGLTLLNGVFSAAEIAIVALRATRVRELAARGASGAHLARLRADPERFLATVQIAITVIGASAGAFGGATWAVDTATFLSLLGVPAEWATDLALVAVVGLVSFATLVLGELVPKSLALKWSEPYALFVARPLDLLGRLAAPLVWLLTASSNALLRLFGDHTTFVESEISREELLAVLDRASDVGEVSSHAAGIASRAIALDTLHVRAVMTPRAALAPVDPEATHDELWQLLSETEEERFLVGKTPESLLGFVTTRDLARHLAAPSGPLGARARPLKSVHQNRLTLPVLEDLQQGRVPMAVVIDDEGGLEGVVDVDELAEEIVGALVGADEAGVVRERAGTVSVPGTMRIHRANHLLDLDLPTSPRWSTLGGLVLARLGRTAAVGDVVQGSPRHALEVVAIEGERVRQVRIRATVEERG